MSLSWKSQLQISDLANTDRIEVECKVCGFFRYEEAAEWQGSRLMTQLYWMSWKIVCAVISGAAGAHAV